MFSQQILAQFPGKIAIFTNKFEDLFENAIWIKKPTSKNTKSSIAQKKTFIKANSRKNNFNRTMKPSRGTQKNKPKAPTQKAQTFKKKSKKVNFTKDNEVQENTTKMRKTISERQPKQVNKLQKVNSSHDLSKKHEIKKNNRYSASNSKIPSKIDKSHKAAQSRVLNLRGKYIVLA